MRADLAQSPIGQHNDHTDGDDERRKGEVRRASPLPLQAAKTSPQQPIDSLRGTLNAPHRQECDHKRRSSQVGIGDPLRITFSHSRAIRLRIVQTIATWRARPTYDLAKCQDVGPCFHSPDDQVHWSTSRTSLRPLPETVSTDRANLEKVSSFWAPL